MLEAAMAMRASVWTGLEGAMSVQVGWHALGLEPAMSTEGQMSVVFFCFGRLEMGFAQMAGYELLLGSGRFPVGTKAQTPQSRVSHWSPMRGCPNSRFMPTVPMASYS